MRKDSLIGLIARLRPYISRRRKAQLIILFILMLLSTFAEVLSIGAVIPFLGALTAPDQVYGNQYLQPAIEFLGIESPSGLALPLTIIFSCTAIAAGLFRMLFIWFQTRLSHAMGADLSIEIYRRTLYQPYSVHVARNSSEVISGITAKSNGVVNGTMLPILTIASSTFMLCSVALTLAIIQPTIAIVSLCVLGTSYLVISFIVRKQLDVQSKSISRESTNIIKALQEGMGGIRDILIDGAQEEYCSVYHAADRRMRTATAYVQIISLCPRYVIEALGMVLVASIAYFFADKDAGIASTIPVLGAMAIGAQRLLPVAQQIYSSMAFIRGGRANLVDALTLLDQPLPVQMDRSSIPKMDFKHSLKLEGLEFRYGPSLPLILKGINLEIPKGSRVGIIGSTGSGKSTLLDVLMGLLYPTAGRFLVDECEISAENARSWQRLIAHVPQAIFLSDTSVAENIAFGERRENINLERVRDAARKAQLSETIEALEHKYDTFVGERGVRLSGGQRQRIGIARALYKQVEVLILDEATSALDSETESAVMNAVGGLGDELTILIVAHRVSTLHSCDIIVELNDGIISRVGTYNDIVLTQHR